MARTFEEVFTTVDQLRPDTKGHNLVLKVVDAKVVLDRPGGRSGSSPSRVAECLVGDETGMIVFSAKNEHVDLAKPGEYLVFRNARIDMFRGSMRLAVNEWGKVEAAEPNQDFQVKVDDNMSLIEFELVQVQPAAVAPQSVAVQ
ncbi:hypothetical protein ABBQ38_002868 [Trebouxia sp. C0009 RCD-2024]